VGTGAPEGGGPRRSGSAAALRDSGEQLSAAESHRGKGRGQRRSLTSRRTLGTPRWRQRRGDGSGRRWRTTAAARRTTGERGQRELERGKGNWSASRVADVGAKLTVAEGTTELQRRRRNELGRRRFNGGGALACAPRGGKVGEGSAGAQMREGERASGVLGSSDRGRGGCVLHARRGRGVRGTRGPGRRLREDDGADSRGPRAERERKAGAGAEKAAALTGGPARAEREGGKRRARGIGPAGPKGRGGQGCGLLSFFFYSGICFLFSFYLFYLIQIQISHKFKLAFLRIMHQTKIEFRV
jgi:hypothetical protein